MFILLLVQVEYLFLHVLWKYFINRCPAEKKEEEDNKPRKRSNTNEIVRPLVLSLMTIINYNWNSDIFIKSIRMNVFNNANNITTTIKRINTGNITFD